MNNIIVIKMSLWPYHWGNISAARAEEVLERDGTPGSYLIRENVRDTIVSYIDYNGSLEHITLPVRKDCNLFKVHPHLDGKPDEIFSFMRDSMQSLWVYPVVLEPGERMETGEVNLDHKADCRVCGKMNVSKYVNIFTTLLQKIILCFQVSC